MPLFYQQNINQFTRLAIWKIEESESFFSNTVPLQNSITHNHKRLQHLAGRFLLKYLYPSFPYHAIEIADTKKPFLPNEDFHFSISHCGDYAAAIVSTKNRVGLDIELSTDKINRIASKFLNETEFKNNAINLQEITVAQQNKLTLLWSAKEAIFKWWGNGKVDFSEMIKINSFVFSENGTIPIQFKNHLLQAHYKQLNNMYLVYVISDINT